MNTKRICLWSSPRNLSTALMYSFSQRPDTLVVDEPLYAHYLHETDADHPGKEEILQSQVTNGEKVIEDILHKNYGKPVVFFKQMTHHLVNLATGFLQKTDNIIYIRDPKQIISSYAQVRPNVEQSDIGIRMQWELFNDLCAAGIGFTILDSGELLKDPPKVLSSLCNTLQIPYYEQMLSWPAGPKPEDGIWAKYWYNNVHQSVGFEKQETSSRPLPDYLLPLYEECKYYYDQLYHHSIKA